MTVKIVTDSGADLPEEIIENLGITVVPLHIIFDKEDYLDKIDISGDELYQRLVEGPVHPTTSTASPGEFAETYQKLAKDGADGIISIHLSEKLSKTYGSALQGKQLLEAGKKKTCKIEVIDSAAGAMGMGLLVMLAAKLAQEEKNLADIVSVVQENVCRIHLMGALDTVKYLIRGGRAPKVAILSDILNIKNFIKLKDGEIVSAGRTRKQKEKIGKLVEFVRGFSEAEIEAIALEYSTDKAELDKLNDEIRVSLPNTPIYLSRLGPALGVHCGPGTLMVSIKTKK